MEDRTIDEMVRELKISKELILEIRSALVQKQDIRESFDDVKTRTDIMTIEDIKEGDTMSGTVRNVVDFGAFIDIGLHNDGLVHISQLSNKFVKNPYDIVNVGDVVTVRIIGIDKEKEKVSLSMKET